MFKLTSHSTVPMTKVLALTIHNMERVPGERELSRARLLHLEREIDAGTVLPFNWTTAHIKGNKTQYRINGQHTAYIFSTSRQPKGVVNLTHYTCDTLEDVINLWSRQDPSFSARTKNEVLNTAFSSDEGLQGLPKKQARTAASAAALLKVGMGQLPRISHFEKAQIALENRDFIEWACEVFPGKSKCVKVGVFLAALVTYRSAKKLATTFWREVQEGTNPDPNSPSRALQRLLLEYSADHGRGARGGNKSLAWEPMAELSLAAWEACLTGRNIKSLRLSSEGLSKYVQLGSEVTQVA